MSDIFREVDEEVRREQLQKLWDRYGVYLIAAAALIVAAVGGWRAYEWYEAKKAGEAGAAFEQALQLAKDGKHGEAATAFAQLAAKGPPAYRMLSRLREGEEFAANDANAATAMFDALAADQKAPQLLRDVAAIRAGLLLVDTAPFAEISRRLEPLATPKGALRHSARELLALSAWRNGDLAAALRWGDAALADPDAPASLRARVDILMAVAGEGAKS